MLYFRGTKRQFSLVTIFQVFNQSGHWNALFQVSYQLLLYSESKPKIWHDKRGCRVRQDKGLVIYFLISEFKIFGWMIFGSVPQTLWAKPGSKSVKLNIRFRFIPKRTKNNQWARSFRYYFEFFCQESELYRIRSSFSQAKEINS